ncbi:MAG: hypothetical protein A2580_09145 [Hydrogenophilales bacterium RIFOXYD1_FULL_62_11]|nr:MAG: hypothetical protein A2580_09145 [Hydrogenophilales bacterium RIFOXYD1_FULL_62_11]
MQNIKRALAQLIRTFGIEVSSDDRGLKLYWGLFTQGSGVNFEGGLGDFRPVIQKMRANGGLKDAVRIRQLIDDGEITVKIKITDHRYTHENTMDVEIDGPHSIDDAETLEVIERFRGALEELKCKASCEAHSLIHDYVLLSVSEDEVMRTYTTARFMVDLIRAADTDCEALDWNLEGLEDDEIVDCLRSSLDSSKYVACNFKVVISEREDADSDDWEEVYTEFIGGGLYEHSDVKGELRDLARNAIYELRKERNNQCQLKEAA